MRSADESQQSAELRQAFLRHLPKRVDVLRRRGLRLCGEGWDINALSMLYQDAQALAGATGKYSVLDVSEQLYALELLLEPFVREERIPDEEASERVREQLERFPALFGDATDALSPGARSAPQRSVDPDSGVSNQRVAPPAYWRRWTDDATADPATRPSTANPGPATPASGKRVFVLDDGQSRTAALVEQLVGFGHSVERIEAPEEFVEVLGALTPDLAIIAGHLDAGFDSIGERVRTIRQKSGRRLALVVLAESDDLSARLRAMRAGADAFIAAGQELAAILEQVAELLEAERPDPFRVLIVEDDRSQALFAESILRNAGMETRAETDPMRVLAVLDEFHPDLILMDLYMPNIDGMELTAIIRERDAFVGTPIVFLSGEHDQEKHFAALDAGGDDFLAKPIRPKYLISAVTNRVRRARASHQRIRQSNQRDPVTGLYERAYLLDRLSAALAREQPTTGGVLFIEIDGAPALRERLTLAVYETIATQAGALIAETIDDEELAARYSDRSYILLCGQRGEEALEELAASILKRFRDQVFEHGTQSLALPISIGICSLALGMGDAGAVLTAAERACRLARDDKRSFVSHRPAVLSQVKDERTLAATIGTALREDGFELLFQPVLPVHGEADQYYQVLLRMRDATGRMRAAGEIVPVAERAGSVIEVDRWVLTRTLRTLDEREREGAPVTLFVSLSLPSLLSAELGAWIAQTLDTRRVPGTRLVVDFKPGQVQDHLLEVAAFCARLEDRGVGFCLSSVDLQAANGPLLERLPTRWIKIHPRYVGNQPEALGLRSELARIVDRAHTLERKVIAPHIEDAGGAAAIWMAGVDYIQGNFVQGAGQRLEFDFQAAI